MSEQKQTTTINTWIVFSISLLILCGLLILLVWKKIPPEIPWFYSLPWGENQLMSKVVLPIILGLAVVVLSFGTTLSRWTKKDDKIVEQTVLISLTFICLMLVINIAKVLLIFI
ncbi:hypothetical protein A2572_02220 [Candidatus Collierbacteria bacterium RIFOXYD1_FULL_40_9]|uniref:DUF1648 domain-containing protein n=1 Tax=Candidatus Collierbacteria bacterium RIFOXYD1_FULL_40_9 TaxID=1817731 RepID=A0A1F5FTV8_9BACT|nr:MAG: hypothetical protein A2572_02220 [Candidatus Collierbacteria bacterium RIFOXYD1_FULL_40_9]